MDDELKTVKTVPADTALRSTYSGVLATAARRVFHSSDDTEVLYSRDGGTHTLYVRDLKDGPIVEAKQVYCMVSITSFEQDLVDILFTRVEGVENGEVKYKTISLGAFVFEELNTSHARIMTSTVEHLLTIGVETLALLGKENEE